MFSPCPSDAGHFKTPNDHGEMKMRIRCDLGRAAAAFLFCISAAPAMAQTSSLGAGTRLEVQGRGQVSLVPDRVVISAGVVSQAADAATAMRENAARVSRLLAALKKAGIAPRDIRTQALQLSPQYRYADNAAPAIIGYQALTSLNVQFRDIGRSGAILDVLVREGANQISGPSFAIPDREAAENKARQAAVQQVQTRARLYAQELGLKFGRIVSLVEQADTPAPMPMLRAAAADSASKTDIMAGEQDVSILVTAVVELD